MCFMQAHCLDTPLSSQWGAPGGIFKTCAAPTMNCNDVEPILKRDPMPVSQIGHAQFRCIEVAIKAASNLSDNCLRVKQATKAPFMNKQMKHGSST